MCGWRSVHRDPVRSVEFHTDIRDLTRLQAASEHFFFFSGMYLSPFLISVNVQFFSLTSLLPCFFWWIFCFYQRDKAICHTVVELTYDKQDKAFEFPHKTLPILTGCVITMCQCLKSLYLCCCSLAGYCPSMADGNQLPMHT